MGATHHAIGIDWHEDMAERGTCIDEARQRPAQDLHLAQAFDHFELAQHGQADAAVAADRFFQRGVAGFVSRGREIDVDDYGTRAGHVELIDRGGKNRARPRPALERSQATRVDGDDRGIGCGRSVVWGEERSHPHQPIFRDPVERAHRESGDQADDGQQALQPPARRNTGGCGEHHMFSSVKIEADLR